MTFANVAIIGLGLLGGSVGLAVQEYLPGCVTHGYDADPATRARAAARGLVHTVGETAADVVREADLVIFCVPVGAMGAAAREVADALPLTALVSDVGSSKQTVAKALAEALPGRTVIPAHPVAGTERSGPDAGFASLFQHRWCIITPPADANPALVAQLSAFWEALGANVEVMDAEHHDRVLAVTSHLPHLIAYTIVGTASDLETVTQSEVIKYSAGGFRDFTRIAASHPAIWTDVSFANQDSLLQLIDAQQQELQRLKDLILAGDAQALYAYYDQAQQQRDAWPPQQTQ